MSTANILLEIPTPQSAGTLRNLMGAKWWDERRHAAYALHGDTCHACGDHKLKQLYRKRLEAHDIVVVKGMTVEYKRLVALCHACHNFIHNDMIGKKVFTREVSKTYGKRVLRHGLEAIKKEGLTPPASQSFQFMVYDNYSMKLILEMMATKKIQVPAPKVLDGLAWQWLVDGKIYKTTISEDGGEKEYNG